MNSDRCHRFFHRHPLLHAQGERPDRADDIGLSRQAHHQTIETRQRKVRAAHLLCLAFFGLTLLLCCWFSGSPAYAATDQAMTRAEASRSAQGRHVVLAAPPCTDNLFLDPNCWIQHRSQWMAQGLLDTLRPLLEGIMNSPLNFVERTPTEATYAPGAPVQVIVTAMIAVADAALLIVLAILGYNIMLGHYFNLRSAVGEDLPRVILAAVAAHFSQFFVRWLIDINNALISVIIQIHALTLITQTLKSIFTGNIIDRGWLLFVLALIVCVMVLLLVWQMLVRLAFLLLLIGLSPLGLLCFAIPQTQSWGRLWLSNFVTTVFVQFFQVTALALGSMLFAQLLAPAGDLISWVPFAGDILPLLTSLAVFYLVLKIPGMLRSWALYRVSNEAGAASVAAAQGMAQWVGEFIAEVGPELLALFA